MREFSMWRSLTLKQSCVEVNMKRLGKTFRSFSWDSKFRSGVTHPSIFIRMNQFDIETRSYMLGSIIYLFCFLETSTCQFGLYLSASVARSYRWKLSVFRRWTGYRNGTINICVVIGETRKACRSRYPRNGDTIFQSTIREVVLALFGGHLDMSVTLI